MTPAQLDGLVSAQGHLIMGLAGIVFLMTAFTWGVALWKSTVTGW